MRTAKVGTLGCCDASSEYLGEKCDTRSAQTCRIHAHHAQDRLGPSAAASHFAMSRGAVRRKGCLYAHRRRHIMHTSCALRSVVSLDRATLTLRMTCVAEPGCIEQPSNHATPTPQTSKSSSSGFPSHAACALYVSPCTVTVVGLLFTYR